jgi:hypothetical protein
LYSKLQTRFLVREDALIAKRRNCETKEEEQDKIWSRIPKGRPIPRRTSRLTVGRKKNSNSITNGEQFDFCTVVTPLYPQKLALTLPKSGGRSVGIVRSRTKATELVGSAWLLCGLLVKGCICKIFII